MANTKASSRKTSAPATPKSGLDSEQKAMVDKIMADFLAHAEWGTNDEQKQQDLAAIDERIEKHRQEIALLEQVKADFDNREQKAREFVEQMILLMGATANEKTIMDALCVRTNTAAPKKKRAAKAKAPLDPKIVQAVTDVLDGEGMTFFDIKKQVNLESDDIRKVLDLLLEQKKIGKEGEKRGTRYFLLDVSAPKPTAEPESDEDEGEEPDPDEDEDGEYDDDE